MSGGINSLINRYMREKITIHSKYAATHVYQMSELTIWSENTIWWIRFLFQYSARERSEIGRWYQWVRRHSILGKKTWRLSNERDVNHYSQKMYYWNFNSTRICSIRYISPDGLIQLRLAIKLHFFPPILKAIYRRVSHSRIIRLGSI